MNKLYLQTGLTIQDNFEIKNLNLLLVFQVNCPGCFFYALPLAVKLFNQYQTKGLNILGLSTAFENFELNTIENTQLLIKEHQLVGETKKLFQSEGIDTYPLNIPFPVAFDYLYSSKNLLTEESIELIYRTNPQLEWLQTEAEKIKFKHRLKSSLSLQEFIPYTFTMNQLNGTPTWILFDLNYSILKTWFGHLPEFAIETIIQQNL